ncbi:MAG: sensor histidine kinase [Acidobacteria bacterium]|nr:sensor histidine kinase [Acidobacteriota bacterium]NIQ30661.1 sensor histidine kinase [Acidobacteriota bacterium]NIQ85619.1 sensor histidine kinase [Acidobacteriota bacterium]
MLKIEEERRTTHWTFTSILLGVLVISLLHYLTPPSHAHWHVVYQRLYYIPILFGAVMYGIRGGLTVACLTAGSYLPHILLHWQHQPLYRSNQLAEVVLFLVFGAVSGLLIDRVNREKERHRKTSEELAEANAQLRSTFQRMRLIDRLSALGALSAGIAHEIRNPLGGVSGAVEILDSMTDREDERHEFVGIVKKEIARISTIVSRQLDLVRTNPSERAPCDVTHVVESVVGLVRNQAEKQGVVVEIRTAHDLPTIEADEQGLRQAVLNLLINGIQAMPGHGTITISTRKTKDHVSIIVDDEGPGLSPEALEHVFDPFYTTKAEGTGLGLSIAFQIVDQHGGDLKAENRDGGGARFTLELPIVPSRDTLHAGVAP